MSGQLLFRQAVSANHKNIDAEQYAETEMLVGMYKIYETEVCHKKLSLLAE